MDRVLDLPTEAVTVDAEGGVWTVVVGSRGLSRVDVGRGSVDFSTGVQVRMEDAAGYHRALVVDGLGDADRDGDANGSEIQAGTNPYDEQSTATLALATMRVRYRAGETLVIDISGRAAAAALVFASIYRLGQPPFPGIAGSLRLDPNSLFPFVLPVSIPATVSLTVPNIPAAGDLQLCMQALRAPLILAFGNHACVRLDTRGPRAVTETFDDDLRMDQARSGGSWGNGNGRFAQLGGDGRHGDFDITDGQDQGGGEWLWNTDDQLISRKQTGWLNAQDRVTDGSFYFTNFVLAEGRTLRLIGTKPARFFVRGEIAVHGTIIASGERVPGNHAGRNGVGGPGASDPGGDRNRPPVPNRVPRLAS